MTGHQQMDLESLARAEEDLESLARAEEDLESLARVEEALELVAFQKMDGKRARNMDAGKDLLSHKTG